MNQQPVTKKVVMQYTLLDKTNRATYPPSGRPVMAFVSCPSERNGPFWVQVSHIDAGSRECDHEDWCGDCPCTYDEETDRYLYPDCWVEELYFWGDYTSLHTPSDFEVIGWLKFPTVNMLCVGGMVRVSDGAEIFMATEEMDHPDGPDPDTRIRVKVGQFVVYDEVALLEGVYDSYREAYEAYLGILRRLDIPVA